jgi:hypothetical protein
MAATPQRVHSPYSLIFLSRKKTGQFDVSIGKDVGWCKARGKTPLVLMVVR